MKNLKGFLYPAIFLLLFAFADVPAALAHQPVLEREQTAIISDYFQTYIYEITDPTLASLAIYGRLSSPSEVDVYVFAADKNEIIPVQILVPVRSSNHAFEPALVVAGPDIKGDVRLNVPFIIPPGNQSMLLFTHQPWPEFFEPFSFERLFTVAESSIAVSSGHTYYLAVYAPGHQLGDYTVGIGEVENFNNSPFGDTVKRVGLMKLGLVDSRAIPWLEILGLLLFLSGAIISLGLACQKLIYSKYRIWSGYFIALLGALMLYHETSTNGVATFQAIIALILLGNNYLLSHQMGHLDSAGKQNLAPSIIVSIAGWSAIFFLLVWYLLVSR